MVKPKHNGQKKRKYGALAAGLLGLTTACATYAGVNAWRIHLFDKYVVKQIEIAANVPSVGASHDLPGSLSMESALQDARAHLTVSPLENPAIIWQTPQTSVATMDELLDKAITRTQQIEQFKESFENGTVSAAAQQWVREAHSQLNIESLLATATPEERVLLERIAPALAQLAGSEYGQRIGSEYETLNSVVAGGTRTTAKGMHERHRSLLDTLAKAGGWRSIIRFQADDYKRAHAHVFVGYLMANMGYLPEGLAHFRQAKAVMDRYPSSKNLAILRDTPELSQHTITGLIDSAVRELESLDRDPSKYSTGWWKRLRYYNRSIGGQNDPSIQDMAEAITGRYWARLSIAVCAGLVSLYFGGRYAKRLRNAKQYEVRHEPRR